MLRKLCPIFLLALVIASGLPAQTVTPDVGSGSPNPFVQARFSAAFGRNQFYKLVTLPPVADLQKLGTKGVVQLFYDTAKTSNVRYALVKADADQQFVLDASGTVIGGDVYQVLAPMWSYVASANGTSVTSPSAVNTTGYPTMDTATCQAVGDKTCLFQTFDKKYVLFVYSANLTPSFGATFAVRDPFYTAWITAGAISGLGPAVSPEQALTSPISSSTATMQQYQAGALFNITSGVLNGRLVPVKEPIYSFYLANGGHSTYGYPASEERAMADGRRRQSFEGVTIEYSPGQTPVLLLPVSEISFATSASPIRLSLGDTATVKVITRSSNGTELTDRQVNWMTTNSRVVSIEAKGSSAILHAVGGGSAIITAISEGKSSAGLAVYVTAPCCLAGEGAPNATVSLAIQDAIKRNRLNVKLPTNNPVRRVGTGYAQEFQDAVTGQSYLIAAPENVPTAYLVKGDILARYLAFGGLAGSLGYPTMDATPAGRQLFANHAALAGTPVRLVQGAILDKWATTGYEGGPLGMPAGEPLSFFTFMASSGLAQAFLNGVAYAASSGALAGRCYVVTGSLLSKYLALGGPAGVLGMPASDEVIIDGRKRQQFEGGQMELAPGAAEPEAQIKERHPLITATPAVVTAGSRVRLTAGGFAAGSEIRVSMTGQADFVAPAPLGGFAWDAPVPAASSSGIVQVRAVSGDGATAEGSYRIRSLLDADPRLVKTGGDAQTGAAGSLLRLRLQVALRDSSGNPLPGVSVTFQASPGGAITEADATTNMNGEASALARLPSDNAVALYTATAARQVVTFSARSAAFQLEGFPRLRQSWNVPLGPGQATIAERGALLASIANLIRYHQDRGAFPSPNGTADVTGLNAFLKNLCFAPDPSQPNQPAQICDGFLNPPGADEWIVNLWRVPAFVGGAATWESGKPELETMRDWLLEGTPVLVALKMSADGAPAGMHFIVATGVAANGGVESFDPGDMFGRSAVNNFLDDFQLKGRTWKGEIVSVLRMAPRALPPSSFFLYSPAAHEVFSEQGVCGFTLDWLDRTATPSLATGTRPFRQTYCEGSSAAYQLNVSEPAGYQVVLTDLGTPPTVTCVSGTGESAWRLTGGPAWAASPQRLEMDAYNPALNAASLTPDLAPGSLMALFGSGLFGPDQVISIEIDGVPVEPYLATTFRVNVPLGPGLEPGPHLAKIQSSTGSAEFYFHLAPAAPAVFQDSSGQPMAWNPDGQRNSQDRPVARGSSVTIVVTGLGAMEGNRPVEPLAAFVAGREVTPEIVGPAKGIPAAWTVRVPVPVITAPGSAVPVVVQQGDKQSFPVPVRVD